MSIIGYIRVSSNKQTLEHQRFEISQFATANKMEISHWVQETISSRQPLDKRQLGELLKKLKRDDILISCEISRLGRSLLEVMRILETCMNKGVKVWTIKEIIAWATIFKARLWRLHLDWLRKLNAI